MPGVKGQWNECRCRTCKKKFIRTEGWAYRNQDRFFCSWSCLRTDERQREAARKRGPMIMPTR